MTFIPSRPLSSYQPAVQSPDFGFLVAHDPLLVGLAAMAEFYALSDANTALLKARQFAEALLQRVAARAGRVAGPETSQARQAVALRFARQALDRLKQATLAKAFRGELVAQSPNDKPASVLLDRIRVERASAPPSRRARRTRAGA